MKEIWEKWLVINKYWIAPPHSLVYNIFVDDTYVQHFYTWSNLIAYFLPFIKGFIICWFYFWQISPPPNICKKIFSKHILDHSCYINSLAVQVKHLEVLKMSVFPILHLSTCQWGGGGL